MEMKASEHRLRILPPIPLNPCDLARDCYLGPHKGVMKALLTLSSDVRACLLRKCCLRMLSGFGFLPI